LGPQQSFAVYLYVWYRYMDSVAFRRQRQTLNRSASPSLPSMLTSFVGNPFGRSKSGSCNVARSRSVATPSSSTLPVQCQHLTLEEEFSDPSVPLATPNPCVNACCYCRNEHETYTGTLRRKKLVEAICLILVDGAGPYKKLYSVLNKPETRQQVWTVAKSNVSAGMVGSLILQLLGCRILCIVKGTTKLNWTIVQKDGSSSFAYKDDTHWARLIYIDE